MQSRKRQLSNLAIFALFATLREIKSEFYTSGTHCAGGRLECRMLNNERTWFAQTNW